MTERMSPLPAGEGKGEGALTLILTLVLLLLTTTALAAPLNTEVKSTSESLALGEPFQLTVTLQHPAEERYEYVPPADFGAFELRKQDRQRKDQGPNATTTFTLELALFELEAQQLPKLTFDVTTAKGVERYELEGPTITGTAVLPQSAVDSGEAPRDLKSPMDVPVRTWRLLWIASAVFFGALLLYFLIRWLRHVRANLRRPVPVLPLEDRTRAALRSLQAENLPEKGRTREFYFRLSEILRSHLGERYAFEALECTGTELVERLNRLPAPELPKEELKQFVEESDLVKFAKMEVDPSACESALKFGFTLVERTVVAQPHVP